jgi:hypothetical protein
VSVNSSEAKQLSNMNKKEKCIADTKAHMEHVRKLTKKLANMVIERGENHDSSKLEDPEFLAFVNADRLSDITYGSALDNQQMEGLKPALEHHYATNRHHPQHYPNGVAGMNLVDVIELLCDWYSSAKRHNDGNLLKTIDLNAERFDIDPQLTSILRNTVELLELH